MFTVKFVTYDRPAASTPASTRYFALRVAAAVYVEMEADGRQVVQLNGIPGATDEFERVTVGAVGDTSYDVAYIMNAAGKTVETVR